MNRRNRVAIIVVLTLLVWQSLEAWAATCARPCDRQAAAQACCCCIPGTSGTNGMNCCRGKEAQNPATAATAAEDATPPGVLPAPGAAILPPVPLTQARATAGAPALWTAPAAEPSTPRAPPAH
jgi:hypothetical protein